jgi:dienelactone hydrolase
MLNKTSMGHSISIILAFFISLKISAQTGYQTLIIPAPDRLTVTADLYVADSTAPVILLCHQAGYSRGEYLETAKRLQKFGFTCLAIDQRSGKESNAVRNETARAAALGHFQRNYIDARHDIIAGIDFLYSNYHRRVIVLGSSYSASLALIEAKENPQVAAVVAFSPGEYFGEKDFVSKKIEGLDKPVYAASSLSEASAVTELLKDVASQLKVQFIPTEEGNHGSKVLWTSNSNNQEYWITLMAFLSKVRDLK